MRQLLLQNTTAILLQNATEVYYKMRQGFYYRMRQLLQNATLITNCGSTQSHIKDTLNYKQQKCMKLRFSICKSMELYVKVSLAKWFNVRLRTKWLWVRVPLQLL